jgi:hypothetical protein
MHDLFEGVIPYELGLFLRHHSCFTVGTLNHRLNAFDFGYSEVGDKPSSIDGEFKLRQTASQRLFARILPLLVGDLIPRGDSHWGCLLILLEISRICSAPVLSADTAAYLEVLIEEHHTRFKKLYPITPKMHFLVHFSRQILDFGPLIQTWTFRHEAKLRIMKRAARVSNFKNVCQTGINIYYVFTSTPISS